MTKIQLEKLGKLIKIIGTNDLDVSFYKHKSPVNEVDTKMAMLPKRFSVCTGKTESGDLQWKWGDSYKIYGFRHISITMVYLKEEGGENIEDKSTV